MMNGTKTGLGKTISKPGITPERHGFLARFCDDGWRCPGHPEWKSGDTHRALMSNIVKSNVGLEIVGDRLFFTAPVCSPYSKAELDAITNADPTGYMLAAIAKAAK